MVTVLAFMNARIPSRLSSRPTPLRLVPPNGEARVGLDHAIDENCACIKAWNEGVRGGA